MYDGIDCMYPPTNDFVNEKSKIFVPGNADAKNMSARNGIKIKKTRITIIPFPDTFI